MRRFLLPLVGLLVGSCGFSANLGDLNPFGGSDPAPSAAAPVIQRDRIANVESIEIGRSYKGYLVQATGYTVVEGYFEPQLRPLNGGKPAADGLIELEFIARPPVVTNLGVSDLAARRVIAAQFLGDLLVQDAKGVRVIAEGNSVQAMF
jgi:hypothetical protein